MMPCYHSLRVSNISRRLYRSLPPSGGLLKADRCSPVGRTSGLGAEDVEPPIGGLAPPALCDPGIEPDGPPRKYDLLRRAAEEVIPRPALGQEVEKRIGRADP